MAETGSCRIITSPGYGGVEEKNSRFLSEALFVDSEEAARSELARVRKQYYDARHHCSAWIIGPGGETVRSGDDGEPAGTAGRPILEVIRGAGVTNAMVVVTRYFGGTLLGTGGLVRAYTAATRDALEHAEIRELCLCEMLEVSADYGEYEKVRRYLYGQGVPPDSGAARGTGEYGAGDHLAHCRQMPAFQSGERVLSGRLSSTFAGIKSSGIREMGAVSDCRKFLISRGSTSSGYRKNRSCRSLHGFYSWKC